MSGVLLLHSPGQFGGMADTITAVQARGRWTSNARNANHRSYPSSTKSHGSGTPTSHRVYTMSDRQAHGHSQRLVTIERWK